MTEDSLGIERPTVYFQYRGEVNTKRVLNLGRQRALELGILKMVVPSETGRSALRALEVLTGTNIQLIVVTHYPASTWGPKGDIPVGINRPEYQHVKRYLEEHGVVVLQGTRPFGGVSQALSWSASVPVSFAGKTLELFSAGTKIAIETALIATDTGALEEGEEVVSLGGTYKGLDTALVVKTSYSGNIFSKFEVLELIAKPHHPGKQLPEYDQEGWKGDMDVYYQNGLGTPVKDERT